MYFNSLFLNPLYDAAREYYLQLNPPLEAIKKQIYPYLAIPHPKAPIKCKNIVYIFLESFDVPILTKEILPNYTTSKCTQKSYRFF